MKARALLVVAVFFLVSFNAHACLVPFFPQAIELSSGHCPSSSNQSDKTFCDIFTAIGIDGVAKSVPHNSDITNDAISVITSEIPLTSALPVHTISMTSASTILEISSYPFES